MSLSKFACPNCGEELKNEDNLVRHQQTVKCQLVKKEKEKIATAYKDIIAIKDKEIEEFKKEIVRLKNQSSAVDKDIEMEKLREQVNALNMVIKMWANNS